LKYLFCILCLYCSYAVAQDSLTNLKKNRADYVLSYDTLLHIESWYSTKQTELRLFYPDKFRIFLAPSEINNLQLDFSYRFIDAAISFTPGFLNPGNPAKGQTSRFNLGGGFAAGRWYFSGEHTRLKGFYMRNSDDYRAQLGNLPYITFPNLESISNQVLIRYNTNRLFSTGALRGGMEIQKRSAMSFLPTLLFAQYKLRNAVADTSINNQVTRSTDINFILPLSATWVIHPKWYLTGTAGPSIGADFFNSDSYNSNNQLTVLKGTRLTTGYLVQLSAGFNARQYYFGADAMIRSYAHQIENIDKMEKYFYSVQFYFGVRLRAPKILKKSVDWVNKISPISFD
jgi:hypothetical protein